MRFTLFDTAWRTLATGVVLTLVLVVLLRVVA
jgi:hypothetical protein